MAAEYLFVYGTLRKGFAPGSVLIPQNHVTFIGKGFLQGRLFEVDDYPGAILSENPADRVRGEVYSLHEPQAVLARLDDYEGCGANHPEPHEYKREKHTVSLEEGGPVMAWVYLFTGPTDSLRRIVSGDYMKFVQGKEG